MATGGKTGIADIPLFAGVGLMGGAMLRDFAIVATAFEVDVAEAKKAGLLGATALALGTVLPFIFGAGVALAASDIPDLVSMTTIGGSRRDHLHRRAGYRFGLGGQFTGDGAFDRDRRF